MYEIDGSSLFAAIESLLALVGGALRLDPAAYQIAFASPAGVFRPVIWIVLIAGLSLMLGQSVVLFANRVPPRRFAFSLVWGAIKFLIDVLVVVTVMWAIANVFGERPWNHAQVARGLALAATPYWFGFLILIPYLGMIIDRFLKIYVFLALVVAIQVVFGVDFWNALWAGAITLAVSQLVSLGFGRLLTPLNNRLDRLVMGGQDENLRSARQIYEYFARRDQIILEEGSADGLDSRASL